MRIQEDLGGSGEHFNRIWEGFWHLWVGSYWKKYGQHDIFAKISSTIKINFHKTLMGSFRWTGTKHYQNTILIAIVQPYLIAISSLIDKTLRMRNEIQVWLSIICKTLQQSLTKALEILRRATTQFLNRTPALIREASQCAGVPPRVVRRSLGSPKGFL